MALIQKAFSDIITFSRSSNATRVGPTGLVEYAPHNLLTYSEQLDNADWIKSSTTVTANAAAAPDGTVTADLVTASTSSGFGFFYSSNTFSGTFTVSVYAKAGTQRYIQFLSTGSAAFWANFDLQDGLAYAGGTTSAVSIAPVGGGWYRCSATVTDSTANQHTIGFVTSLTAGRAQTSTLNTHFYAWGAQVSVGPYALDYTPTTSAAVYGPRFDFDPVTLAARGLLVEESRTNLLTYSEQFDNAAWTKDTGSAVTANATAAPDGTVTAEFMYATTVSTVNQRGIYQGTSLAVNTTYAFSVYAKKGTSNFLAMRHTALSGAPFAWFNLNTGAVGTVQSGLTASIQSVGNGWYRCAIAGTTSGSISVNRVDLNVSDADNSSAVAVDGGIYIWGAQLEAGSFATSYIPTIASTVTRSADVASVNTLSPWWNATESTIYSEFDTFSTNDAFPYSFGTKNNNEIGTYRIGSNGNVATLMFASTVLQNNSTIATGTALNATIKAAYAIKANDLAGSANGGAAVTDTTATLPSVSTLYLGSRDDGTGPLNGHLRRLAVYPRRLTNAELQALTA